MALTKIKTGSVSDSITLTSPDINTPDIDGGTINGTLIGAATPAAISGTTGQFGTSLNVDGTATMDVIDVNGTITAYGLNFDISDGVEINALESIVFDIDSDNNQSSRVFQVKANNSTPLFTIQEEGNVQAC